MNYATTEKEFLAIVFACDKFRPYVVDSKVTIHIDHAAIRYLMSKKDAKPRLIRWVLLLQEFDLHIIDRKHAKNSIANNLSRLENIYWVVCTTYKRSPYCDKTVFRTTRRLKSPSGEVKCLYNLSSSTQGAQHMASCSGFRGLTRIY
jgi:hypothetical protein